MTERPGDSVCTHRTPRVVAARRLTTRSGRERAGRFLAEGAQAVREALRHGRVHELFVTEDAARRHPDLVAAAARVSTVTPRAAELLSETVTPQGLVAVCDTVDVPLSAALSGAPRLVAVLAGVADPGNAGTVLRVADAAGADAVILAGDTVDVHNGKCVRASTGSLFHLPVARERDPVAALTACRAAGLLVTAADGHADTELTAADRLAAPTAWVFGSEAHGLPAEVRAAADRALRVPIYGRAESLNLATAAAVCLYASAMAASRAGAVRPTGG
ncbi:RNA methyltransferase, TrmH family [Amycolatopsis arida]|uniref:RNA methyltransferase, TrmH family n=1 Tax=Amycolatopsis arida TaxID=587909 RepID=A0A1I6AH16_9PSEU|nr:RNA methyltransferase [Amycolatopsis arida]TDX97739.1 TrmH family RNA methyltransferase [Amycolatopsis arida]SFQ67989.1 RNA methyltransferase, TrmH family [Amycolatopsis arida]